MVLFFKTVNRKELKEGAEIAKKKTPKSLCVLCESLRVLCGFIFFKLFNHKRHKEDIKFAKCCETFNRKELKEGAEITKMKSPKSLCVLCERLRVLCGLFLFNRKERKEDTKFGKEKVL